MGISKKKRKYIKKNYPKLSLEAIAGNTGTCIKDVKKILNIDEPDRYNVPENFDKVLEWGILFAVFFAPLVFIPDMRDASNIPQDAFVQCLALLLAIVWCLKGVAQKKLSFIWSALNLPLFAFVAWCLVTLAMTHNLFEGQQVFYQALFMVVFFLVVLNVYYKKEDFHRVIMALVLSGGAIALIGICQYLFEFSWIPQARPPAATFTNKNMASQFIVLVIPFGALLFLKAENPFIRWTAIVLTGMMALFVVYTKTLAAWVSIGAELFVFLSVLIYLGAKKKYELKLKTRLLALVLTFTCFLLLINVDSGGWNFKFGGVFDQMAGVQKFVKSTGQPAGKKESSAKGAEGNKGAGKTSAKSTVQKQSTIEWRWAVWLNSLEMIKDNPIAGVGPGNYKIEYPLYSQSVAKDTKFNLKGQLARAHNDYIQAAAEFGITGLALILWAVLCFYYTLFYLLKKDLTCEKVLLTGAIMSAGTGMLLNACFSFPFQRAIPPFIVMLIAASASVLYVQERKITPVTIIDKRVLYSVTAVLIGLFFFMSHYHYSMIKSDQYMGRTIICYNNGRWQQLLLEADKALSYNLGRKRVLFYKGYASFKLGRVKKSIEYYEQLIDSYPNYINGLINLGLAYGRVKEDEKAAEIFKKITKLLPEKGSYFNDAGHYLTKLGKFDQAYTYMKKAVELESEKALIQYNFAIVCMQMGKNIEARKALEKVAELKPEWLDTRKYLKVTEEKIGLNEK